MTKFTVKKVEDWESEKLIMRQVFKQPSKLSDWDKYFSKLPGHRDINLKKQQILQMGQNWSHFVFKREKIWSLCIEECVCVRTQMCIVIGREGYAIDKLWRKKSSVLGRDLKVEAQSKARIKQLSTVRSAPYERVPSG